jgi:hypothetical protein
MHHTEKTMGIGAQLESGTARERRVVEIGQGLNFSDVGKILCNSPFKTLLQQILAEIQNSPYYPRLLAVEVRRKRLKERR